MLLLCGDLSAGTITAPGETDLFTFSGQAGELTTLALTSTSGFATRPNSRSAALTVFTPAGAAVGSTILSNGQAQYALPATGSYTARVSADRLALTGSFTLRRTYP